MAYNENLRALAWTITVFSCEVQPGDNVLIQAEGLEAQPLVRALIEAIDDRGGHPFFELVDTQLQRAWLERANADQMETYGDFSLEKLKRMQALIVISALDRPDVYAGIPPERIALFSKNYMDRCFYHYGVTNTKWIYLKYPTKAMAAMFGRGEEAFSEFYFHVCSMDYAELSRRMDPLLVRMERADEVLIRAPQTELQFSVKGMRAQKGEGKNGLPDGEAFLAPRLNSANGRIAFNCPLRFRGVLFHDVVLSFANGVVTDFSASNREAFANILSLDDGARRLGEFAFGLNPRIQEPMGDTLFDEKIGGSIHLALGNAYVTADNGNRSGIHMDMILRLRPEAGGGEIRFDGELIQKDGRFVPDDLLPLNQMQ